MTLLNYTYCLNFFELNIGLMGIGLYFLKAIVLQSVMCVFNSLI